MGERKDDKTPGKQHGEVPAHSDEKSQMLHADNESINGVVTSLGCILTADDILCLCYIQVR